MDIIVGLGNPGERYKHSRHNIGFDVVDMLAQQHGIEVQQYEAAALCGAGLMGDRAVLLIKPQTYMNTSGEAVAPLVLRYLPPTGKLIVIHDDIDLPLGKIRPKWQGGDAGHRGIRSIIACLHSGDFVRLRMGVGRPPDKEDVVHYVLSPFTDAEAEDRRMMMTHAVTWVEECLADAGTR